MIPKIIHQIWLGNSKPSKLHLDCQKSVQKINSDYEYYYWTNDNIQEFEEFNNIYLKSNYKNYALLSDVLRLYILQKYGGIYIDMDMEAVKPLSEYQPQYQHSFIICKDKVEMQNCILFSQPNHYILQKFINLYSIEFQLTKKIRIVSNRYKYKLFNKKTDIYIEYDKNLFLYPEYSKYLNHKLTKTWSLI